MKNWLGSCENYDVKHAVYDYYARQGRRLGHDYTDQEVSIYVNN